MFFTKKCLQGKSYEVKLNVCSGTMHKSHDFFLQCRGVPESTGRGVEAPSAVLLPVERRRDCVIDLKLVNSSL